MDNKLIYILAVVSHHMFLLDHTEEQDVGYSLGVIPDRIGISGEVTNYFGVCHSCIKMDTWILYTGSIYNIWYLFSIDECISYRLVIKKAPFLLILAFAAVARMVFPTCIILELLFSPCRWYAIYVGPLVLRFEKTWVQGMGGHPITWWGIPS